MGQQLNDVCLQTNQETWFLGVSIMEGQDGSDWGRPLHQEKHIWMTQDMIPKEKKARVQLGKPVKAIQKGTL